MKYSGSGKFDLFYRYNIITKKNLLMNEIYANILQNNVKKKEATKAASFFNN